MHRDVEITKAKWDRNPVEETETEEIEYEEWKSKEYDIIWPQKKIEKTNIENKKVS